MGVEAFSPAVREWFGATFPEPTPAQARGWPAIASGQHTLILAPTGSGKTLAALLLGLPPRAARRGRGGAPGRLGLPIRAPTVALRTGDTAARDRAALARHPPDVLIT